MEISPAMPLHMCKGHDVGRRMPPQSMVHCRLWLISGWISRGFKRSKHSWAYCADTHWPLLSVHPRSLWVMWDRWKRKDGEDQCTRTCRPATGASLYSMSKLLWFNRLLTPPVPCPLDTTPPSKCALLIPVHCSTYTGQNSERKARLALRPFWPGTIRASRSAVPAFMIDSCIILGVTSYSPDLKKNCEWKFFTEASLR